MNRQVNPSGIVASTPERALNKTIQCPHCNKDLLLLKADCEKELHWPQWAVSRAREIVAELRRGGSL